VGYTLPGHLAQYMLVQEEVIAAGCLLPLPSADIPYFAASMAEPISCVFSAQERNVHMRKDGPLAERRPVKGLLTGGVTVVSGAGVMGRMHAELALRFRPRALIVVDVLEARLRSVRADLAARAAAVGCRLVCVTPDLLDEELKSASGGRGADDLILAVGIRNVQQKALGLLAAGGVANLFGGLPRGDHLLELDSLAVHYREIRLVGSSGGEPSDLAASLAALADGSIDAGHYVAAVGCLEDAVEVLKMVKDSRLEGRAILYPHVQRVPLQHVTGWSAADERGFLTQHLPEAAGVGAGGAR
jgi:L-iditol 2-dehydrogenase